ncbi:MAG: outer membrane lipoprotein-sorting protein [Proteobacteria bacterium]|nr:outer membrane lipoprotein-sorting protein [Pseudomonadota bacterium]
MKKNILFIIFLILFSTQTVLALTAREIVEKSDNLPQSTTTMSDMKMSIHSGGSIIDKEFNLEAVETAKNDSKTLITFTKPSKLKLLTHSHPDKEDDQWLMMSSGKVKRITASGKEKSFVNSHFSYEDLSSRKINDYTYTQLSDETTLTFPCYRIEGTPTTKDNVYDKVILYVRQKDFFVVRIDFFKKGKYLKRLENHDIRVVDGILTPFDVRMIETDDKEWTGLHIASITYNQEISSSKFNKEALR